jgi:glycosyltransferase involved in cell wall biosynthesis
MKISYAITVCNELEEIKRLISFLYQHKRPEDEICVLLDKPKASPELLYQLSVYSSEGFIILKESIFQGHFADWKNQLMDLCSGDYIFQIDADEIPNDNLIENLPAILENNVDVILVPRVNTVQGITPQHIQAWGWKQNEKGWVQWPDHQWRIYKNDPKIKWKNKLHEVLDGFTTYSNLPEIEEYALYHPKTIEKQEKQNNFYSKL